MFQQGFFKPLNPEKYVGNVNNIVYRSSWELKVFSLFDKHPDVLKWGSEEIIIKYYNPHDQTYHRYFPDIIALMKDKDGKVKKYLIEIKPFCQTIPPVMSKRKRLKTYVKECITYGVNQAKWKAAKEWCERQNLNFLVLTEKEANF